MLDEKEMRYIKRRCHIGYDFISQLNDIEYDELWDMESDRVHRAIEFLTVANKIFQNEVITKHQRRVYLCATPVLEKRRGRRTVVSYRHHATFEEYKMARQERQSYDQSNEHNLSCVVVLKTSAIIFEWLDHIMDEIIPLSCAADLRTEIKQFQYDIVERSRLGRSPYDCFVEYLRIHKQLVTQIRTTVQ